MFFIFPIKLKGKQIGQINQISQEVFDWLFGNGAIRSVLDFLSMLGWLTASVMLIH